MASDGMESSIRIGKLPLEGTAVFMCDLQEKFAPAMLHFTEVVSNAKKLVESLKILGVPLLVTEQYPQGLGGTVSQIDITHAAVVAPKTKFSMIIPQIENEVKKLFKGKLKCAILFGVEAHVCVEQTAMDLISQQVQVHIVADATTSRSQEDRLLAFERLKQMGCFITTSENIIYKLLGDKNHPKFNEIRPLIKGITHETGLVSKSKMEISSTTKLPSQSRLEIAHSVLIELSTKNNLQVSNEIILSLAKELIKWKSCSSFSPKKYKKSERTQMYTNEVRVKSDGTDKNCTICQKTFTRPQELKRHLKIHENTSSFLCEECGKSYKSRDGLDYHRALHHNQEQSNPPSVFSCTECDKTFSTGIQLKTHLKNSHFRAKSIFTCSICVPERVFTRKDVFKSHNASHDRPKPFTCPVCDKEFSSRSNLRSHTRTHNSLSAIQCQTCSKKFNSTKKLNAHVHLCLNRKSCPSCKFTCYRDDDLTDHMRKIHPGDYAFNSVFGQSLGDIG